MTHSPCEQPQYIDIAVNKEVIKKGGAWFTYGENRVQGRDGLKKLLMEEPAMYDKLLGEVKVILGIDNVDAIEANGNGKDEVVKEKKK